MTTLVDTSAFVAALSERDPRHDEALRWFETMATTHEDLLTHSYITVESTAVIHHRLGTGTARIFLENLLPVCEIRFVDRELHERATVAYLAGIRRGSSFVDSVSFELMRTERIGRAFAFDADFSREGFETVP